MLSSHKLQENYIFSFIVSFNIRLTSCITRTVLMNLISIEYLNVNCRLNILHLIKSKAVFIKHMLLQPSMYFRVENILPVGGRY